MDIECVVPSGDRTGEAALWSALEGALYWVDINRFLVHRYDVATSSTRSWLFDEPVAALSLSDAPDTLLVALASKLVWWHPWNDTREDHGFVLPDHPDARFNDGRADPLGTFWVGSMGNNLGPDGEDLDIAPRLGRLFSVTPDGKSRTWLEGLGISNTVCWSPDGTRFYTADTEANVIWVFDRDIKTGEIGKRRTFLEGFERGSPDGSVVDSEGYLWNCRYGGGCIVRVAPDGRIDRVVETPVANPTTATFGGHDLRTLYFTSAAGQGERLSGSLWAMPVAAPGLPENRASRAPATDAG